MIAWVAPRERKLKRCPEDGRILARLRLGAGVPFCVDYCRGCEGMWFDRGEWDALAERNLHDDLLQIVFEDWQDDAAAELRRAARSELEERVGESDYERIRVFKSWMDGHAERARILGFLSSVPELPAEPQQS